MSIFSFLMEADAFFWGYIGFVLILFLGSYLTLKTNFYQLRAFPAVVKTFWNEIFQKGEGRGVHPLRAFFASVGGMLGVGNVVGIVTAIQLGGPGALFWVWIAGFAGSLIKYSEIYLGLKYREANGNHSYDGGPHFFLKRAFKFKGISSVICILLCIYGAEIYQFNVVVDTVSNAWGLNRLMIAVGLLCLVFYPVLGGLKRVSFICTAVIPFFMLVYVSMCLWIIGNHFYDLPSVLSLVFKSAFTGHAAIGGFAGSTLMVAITNGMASACYAADIGIGYDSTIQAESKTVHPEKQARIALFGVCLDNFICTLSIMVVLVTGLWQNVISSTAAPLVQIALGHHFPYMNLIMPCFIFILGYTTLIAYLHVGIKCAKHLHPARGAFFYMLYSVLAFVFFSFFDQSKALLVMRMAGALLLIINLAGIYRLRHEVHFDNLKVLEGAL